MTALSYLVSGDWLTPRGSPADASVATSILELAQERAIYIDPIQVPIFTWLEAVLFLIFGVHEWVARLISVIFSELTIIMLYFLMAQLFNSKKAGFVAGFIFAVSPMTTYYGRLAQPESMMIFFFVSSLYYFLKWKALKKERYLIISGLLQGLAICTKNLAILFWVPLIGYFVYQLVKVREKTEIRQLTIFLFSSLLFVSLWFLYAFLRWDQYFLYGLGVYGVKTVKTFNTQSLLIQPSFWKGLNQNFYNCFSYVGYLSILSLLLIYKKRKFEDLLFCALGLAGLFYLFIYPQHSLGHDYALYLIVIPVIFFFTKLFSWKTNKRSVLTLFIIFLLMATVNSMQIYFNHYNNDGSYDWSKYYAGIYIRNNTPPDVWVLATYPQIAYYAQRPSICWWLVADENLNDTQIVEVFKGYKFEAVVLYGFDDIPVNPPSAHPVFWNFFLNQYYYDCSFGVYQIWFFNQSVDYDNLPINGGFENGLMGWTISGNGSVTQESSIAYEGHYSAKIEINSNLDWAYQKLTQGGFYINPDGEVYLSLALYRVGSGEIDIQFTFESGTYCLDSRSDAQHVFHLKKNKWVYLVFNLEELRTSFGASGNFIGIAFEAYIHPAGGFQTSILYVDSVNFLFPA